MSGLILVSEVSDSLAELQQVQRLRCYVGGYRTTKGSLKNPFGPLMVEFIPQQYTFSYIQ